MTEEEEYGLNSILFFGGFLLLTFVIVWILWVSTKTGA